MKKLVSIMAMGVLLMSLVACSGDKKETKVEDSLAKIKESGTIILGTSADYPPYEFHNIENGKDEIVGIDIEIAKAVAEDLGVELQIKDMSFDGLIAALNVGEMDFVMSGMASTPEREEAVDFSIPYNEQGQVLLVRTEDVEKYKSVEDLKGLTIGTQFGTVQESYAKENFKDSEVKSIQDNNAVVMELKNKTYDAVFAAKIVAEKFASMQEGLATVDIGAPNEPGYSAAVKKGNTALVEEINKVIDKLKAEGKIEAWIDQYSQSAGE